MASLHLMTYRKMVSSKTISSEDEVPCTCSLVIETFARQTPSCVRIEHIIQIGDKIPLLLGMHLKNLIYSFRESMSRLVTWLLVPQETGPAADTLRRCCEAARAARLDGDMRDLWLGRTRLGLDGVQDCTVWEFMVQCKSQYKAYHHLKLSCSTWRHIQFKPEIRRCPFGCSRWFYICKVPESTWRVSRVSALSCADMQIVPMYACRSCTCNKCNGEGENVSQKWLLICR